MSDRNVRITSLEQLMATHARYPGDRLGGLAGTLPDGILRELGATGSRAEYAVDTGFRTGFEGEPYSLEVFEGVPESASPWQAGPAATASAGTVGERAALAGTAAIGDGSRLPTGPDGLVPTSPPRTKSSKKILLGLGLALVLVLMFGGGK